MSEATERSSAEAFNPEQILAGIRRLPSSEKIQTIKNFKSKLALQREAWASCRLQVEELLESNPDIEKGELMKLVDRLGKEHGFAPEVKKSAERVIDGYYGARKRVSDFKERYPQKLDLVNALTGLDFESEDRFKVEIAPLSIVIETDEPIAGKIYKHLNPSWIGDPSKFPYNAFASYTRNIDPPVRFVVVNRERKIASTLPHELEHQKNKILRAVFDKETTLEERKATLSKYENETDPELRKVLLEDYFQLQLQRVFNYAKDEILAIFKEGGSHNFDIFFKQDGSPYDFLESIRDAKDKREDLLWQSLAQKLLVDKYRQTVEGAISAFENLETEKGYSRDQTIAIFTDKSLPDWPKTARLLRQQIN